MNRFISQKFRFYSFVSISLLLFVHGYNLKETYLEPFSLVKERITFTTFFEYFLANGVLRFRLPLLFIISGYIFALQDYQPYGRRIKKRFKTLVIPYLIWSALGIAMTYLWQQNTLTAQAVFAAQLDQLGDNRPYDQMGWHNILVRWLLMPVAFQLWFIRSLFFYNLIYPVFKWAVTKYPVIWFSLMFLLWLTMFNALFFEGQGLLFFSLGIWLHKSRFRIDKKPEWFSHYLSWLFFVGISVIKTFMAFEFDAYTPLTRGVMATLHVISVSAGILAIWFSCDRIVRWAMRKKWFVWASAFAFVIYGFHIPLLAYVTRLAYMFMSGIPNYRLIVYVGVPALVLLLCIGFGVVLRSLAPRVYKVMTGGRGF